MPDLSLRSCVVEPERHSWGLEHDLAPEPDFGTGRKAAMFGLGSSLVYL